MSFDNPSWERDAHRDLLPTIWVPVVFKILPDCFIGKPAANLVWGGSVEYHVRFIGFRDVNKARGDRFRSVVPSKLYFVRVATRIMSEEVERKKWLGAHNILESFLK